MTQASVVTAVAAIGGMFYTLEHFVDKKVTVVSSELKAVKNELKADIQGIGGRMDALLLVLVGEDKAEAIKMATAPKK